MFPRKSVEIARVGLPLHEAHAMVAPTQEHSLVVVRAFADYQQSLLFDAVLEEAKRSV
jgi:hypothetical protein